MVKPNVTKLRNQVIYSVFVRQYGKEGTFAEVRRDLPRIRDLGVDIVWFLPIHPIGIKGRKGALGSPYAIRDYRAVNPEFGTMVDFRALVDDVHRLGMRCMIDVVYNHTSPDSILMAEHPEWFYRKPDGSFGNKAGEWLDVVDLDYAHPALWEYQIETLRQWAELVDGFRCDVAPLIPLEFWQMARQAVELVKPGFIWLSESVEPVFTAENRARGMVSLSDSEIYQAFDIAYDYDVYGDFLAFLKGQSPLSSYVEALNRQESAYPADYVKLRFLENHDRPRAAFLFPDMKQRRNAVAMIYCLKGTALLYNGQERSAVFRPSLFDRDPIDWESGEDMTPLLRRLHAIKRHPLFAEGAYRVLDSGNGVLQTAYKKGQTRLIGIFSLRGNSALVETPCPDGRYVNQIDGSAVHVEGGLTFTAGEPIVFCTDGK
jgi:glycosidase